MSGDQSLGAPRTPPRWPTVAVLLALVIAACGPDSPGSWGSPAVDRLHEQAKAALARWTDAVGGSKTGLVVVGELTSQIGDWEEAVGENNKIALMSGQVRATSSLAPTTPPRGDVDWPDGRSTTVELLSAHQALDQIVISAGSACSDCRPLVVTAARLTSGQVQTSRGPATAPIWEFGIQGTNVKLTRVAVANTISVKPPPWDPNDAPEGISIDSATGNASAGQLTVSFVGAPDRGDRPCGADYRAEAVESQLAVVVIVVEHRNPTPGACAAVGAERTAVVNLASPLGDRTVLEVKEGLPVRLLEP